MTVEEYQKFVQESPSFKGMTPIDQQRILLARGADMEHFIQIFQEEQVMMKNAVKDFYEKSEKVVKEVNVEVKTKKKEKLKSDEVKDREEAEKIEDKLLDMLKNI